MTNTLYYREITEADRCPECRGILTHGLFREKDRTVWSICYSCGYNYEQFGWPSKHLKPPKKEKK